MSLDKKKKEIDKENNIENNKTEIPEIDKDEKVNEEKSLEGNSIETQDKDESIKDIRKEISKNINDDKSYMNYDNLESQEFQRNENYVAPENRIKKTNKKAYLYMSLVVVVILLAIIGGSYLFKGGFSYGGDSARIKKMADNYIGYDKLYTDGGKTGYKIDLYTIDGNLTDSTTYKDAVLQNSRELTGVYVYDNSKGELVYITSEENKLLKESLMSLSSENNVKAFCLNNKYVALCTGDEINFILKENGKIVNSLEMKSLNLNQEKIGEIFADAIITEDRFIFYDGPVLYGYNIADGTIESMDFYKNNASINIVGEKIFLKNEFGAAGNKNSIFVIDPYEFNVINVITLNSASTKSLIGASTDDCFAVIETKQMENGEKNTFYEVDENRMNEYVLPENEDKRSIVTDLMYYSKGYMYSLSSYSTSNFLKCLDLYSQTETKITINNDNFVPVIK
ncbi:hypothetical protein [Clostridium sp.]|uniref:hypothetical protein n=1 Tax=Clostridium sp. TaxID=1506 RepID=UPI001B657B78|nr:hypothetical protein [Clostridium sp.]MBP3917189.1 hypothetical protein [Clostridium sp.]